MLEFFLRWEVQDILRIRRVLSDFCSNSHKKVLIWKKQKV